MGRTKSKTGINPTRFNKGKRARVDSPSPPRNIEPTKDKKQRYEELKTWSFISERKIILLPEEFDSFLNGLLQRNWTKLADPYRNYDPNIVLEFYTNAWVEDPNNLAQIIYDHIYKTTRLEINKNNEKAKVSLGFPTLITALCASQGVVVNPTIKIRPTIDKKFIDQSCINLEEAHQQPHPPHPANVEDQPSAVPSEQHSATPITMEHIMEYIRASTEHIQLQNASNHKGILYIQQGLYHGSSEGQNNPWMTPAEFNDYLSCSGDRHNFQGKQEHLELGLELEMNLK